MTTLSLAAVKSALDQHLLTFTAGGDVHVQGGTYEPAAGVPYIRGDLPAYQRRPAGIGVSTAFTATGTYQVRVVRPSIEGSAMALSIAARIAHLFRRGTALVLATGAVLTVENATEQAEMPSGDWIVVPVIVSWFCTE